MSFKLSTESIIKANQRMIDGTARTGIFEKHDIKRPTIKEITDAGKRAMEEYQKKFTPEYMHNLIDSDSLDELIKKIDSLEARVAEEFKQRRVIDDWKSSNALEEMALDYFRETACKS